jgi:hypothetical protein
MLLRTLPLANRRAHGTANPGANCHAVGLSQRADGLERLGWEANGDMSCKRSRTAVARFARRGLTVRGVVVVLECLRVVRRGHSVARCFRRLPVRNAKSRTRSASRA